MSEAGKQVKARRERLGMTIQDLAKEAGVSRDTLSDLESGAKDFRQLTLNKVLRALDQVEEEAGVDTPPAASQVESSREFKFEVIDADGFRIVAHGPVEDAEALKRQVIDIVQAMRKREKDSDTE